MYDRSARDLRRFQTLLAKHGTQGFNAALDEENARGQIFSLLFVLGSIVFLAFLFGYGWVGLVAAFAIILVRFALQVRAIHRAGVSEARTERSVHDAQ